MSTPMANPDKRSHPELRIAVAGLGAIGTRVVEALDRGIDGLVLTAVSVQNPEKHRSRLADLTRPPAVLPIEALVDLADIVIECAPAKLVRSIVAPFVGCGKTAIVLSAGAPYIVENNIAIEQITEPLKIFDGSAREAAKGFPANVNVAAALSLAGIGPDRTKIEIWADPALMRNVHRIEVDSDSARFSMSIENIPSENPKTGLITALSVIACLRKLRASLRVGT